MAPATVSYNFQLVQASAAPLCLTYLIPASLCLENNTENKRPGSQVARQITHSICKTRPWVGILKFSGLVSWRAVAWELGDLSSGSALPLTM